MKYNQIIQGDCLSLLKELPDNSIDMSFADPPFNLKKKYSNYKDNRDFQDYLSWCRLWLKEIVRVTKPSGSILVHNIPKWLTYYATFLNDIAEFKCWISWDAPTAPMGKILQPAHYGILLYSKDPKQLKFNEIRHPHKRCRKCGYLIKDYGGKKKGLHPFGPLVSDIWTDIHRVKHKKKRDLHPCFRGDTFIYTDRGIHHIKDIQIGDTVLTHTGNFKKVINKFVTENQNLLKITSMGPESVYCTPSHPFLIKQNGNIKWEEAQKLKKGDKLLFPKQFNFHQNNFMDFSYYCQNKYKKETINITKYINEVLELAKEIFNVNGRIRKQKNQKSIKIFFSNIRMAGFFKNFGRGAMNKHIPSEIFYASDSCLKELLRCYWNGDGQISQKQRNYQCLAFDSISGELIHQISWILNRINICHSMFYAKRKEKNKKPNYTIKVSGKSALILNEILKTTCNFSQKSYIKNDTEYVCYPFLKSEKAPNNTVYNIEVEDDNSYIANGYAVHNCQMPLHLLERIVLMTTDENDVVLDPFIGTGTTCVAAKKLGRNYIGFDIDKRYIEIAQSHLNSINLKSKIDDIYVSYFLKNIITIRDKDWKVLSSKFNIPASASQVDFKKIVYCGDDCFCNC